MRPADTWNERTSLRCPRHLSPHLPCPPPAPRAPFLAHRASAAEEGAGEVHSPGPSHTGSFGPQFVWVPRAALLPVELGSSPSLFVLGASLPALQAFRSFFALAAFSFPCRVAFF